MARTPRTPAQNKRIWSLFAQLRKASGVDEDALKDSLRTKTREISGQDHTSLLSGPQAEKLIAWLALEVGRYTQQRKPEPLPHAPWGPRQPGARDELRITPFQQQLIAALFDLVGWTEPKRRAAFVARQTGGKPWPQTEKDADAVVTPLLAIAIRHVTEADLRARLDALAQADLDAWKTGFVQDMIEQVAREGKSALSAHKLKKIIECEVAAVAAQAVA